MPTTTRKRSKRISRSSRLRKYEVAYDACVKKALKRTKKPTRSPRGKKVLTSSRKKKTKPVKSPRRKNIITSPKKSKIIKTPTRRSTVRTIKRADTSKKTKRPLTTYQKFVQSESKKNRYKGMSSKERMQSIGAAWKEKK